MLTVAAYRRHNFTGAGDEYMGDQPYPGRNGDSQRSLCRRGRGPFCLPGSNASYGDANYYADSDNHSYAFAHADSHDYAYSHHDPNADCNPDHNTDVHALANPNAHAHRYSNPYPVPNSHAYVTRTPLPLHSDCHPNADPNTRLHRGPHPPTPPPPSTHTPSRLRHTRLQPAIERHPHANNTHPRATALPRRRAPTPTTISNTTATQNPTARSVTLIDLHMEQVPL
jgi:hypothetical protein